MFLKVVFRVYNIIWRILRKRFIKIMNDPKFVESKIKVIASDELQEEVDKELEELEE